MNVNMMIVVVIMLHVSTDLAPLHALVIMDIEEMDKTVPVSYIYPL